MVKKYVAINIRKLVSDINDYLVMIEDIPIEINVEITKQKDGKFTVSITEEV